MVIKIDINEEALDNARQAIFDGPLMGSTNALKIASRIKNADWPRRKDLLKKAQRQDLDEFYQTLHACLGMLKEDVDSLPFKSISDGVTSKFTGAAFFGGEMEKQNRINAIKDQEKTINDNIELLRMRIDLPHVPLCLIIPTWKLKR